MLRDNRGNPIESEGKNKMKSNKCKEINAPWEAPLQRIPGQEATREETPTTTRVNNEVGLLELQRTRQSKQSESGQIFVENGSYRYSPAPRDQNGGRSSPQHQQRELAKARRIRHQHQRSFWWIGHPLEQEWLYLPQLLLNLAPDIHEDTTPSIQGQSHSLQPLCISVLLGKKILLELSRRLYWDLFPPKIILVGDLNLVRFS